jgi:hypothetical protein
MSSAYTNDTTSAVHIIAFDITMAFIRYTDTSSKGQKLKLLFKLAGFNVAGDKGTKMLGGKNTNNEITPEMNIDGP